MCNLQRTSTNTSTKNNLQNTTSEEDTRQGGSRHYSSPSGFLPTRKADSQGFLSPGTPLKEKNKKEKEIKKAEIHLLFSLVIYLMPL